MNKEVTLFNFDKPIFKFDNNKKIRMFECFSGIGTQHMALKRLTDNYEIVGISEINKHAIKSYQAIHGDIKNYGDIKNINGKELPQIDILTYSFPCNDISNIGERKGLENTRSGLVYEGSVFLMKWKHCHKC